MHDFLTDPRFAGIEPFQSKVWLSSPTMHGDEQKWVDEAIRTNWVSTVGATYKGQQTGTFGDIGAISFNGNNVLEMLGDSALCNKAPKRAA